MRPTEPRRFTLIDAMVLIAATGFAFRAVREILELGAGQQIPVQWFRPPILGTFVGVYGLIVPFAYGWSLALWLLRLRKPRPRLRRVFRQPGMAASTAALVSIVIVLGGRLLLFSIVHAVYNPTRSEILKLIQEDLPQSLIKQGWLLGNAVAVVWIVSWLAGAWRPEPSWIDRAGRAMGIYWVLNAMFLGWTVV